MSEHQTLFRIAQQACEAHKDIKGAKKYVHRKLKADPELLEELHKSMIARAISEAVFDARHQAMRNLKRAIANPPHRNLDAMEEVGDVMFHSIFDNWTMPDGRMLGDVLCSELPKYIADARGQAIGWSQNAAFFEAIYQDETGSVKVRTRFDEDDIAKRYRHVTIQTAAANTMNTKTRAKSQPAAWPQLA